MRLSPAANAVLTEFFRWLFGLALVLSLFELIKPGFVTHYISLNWWWGGVIILWLVLTVSDSGTHSTT